MTAKHCPGLNKGNVVFLGDHSKKDLDKGEREIQIEKVYGLEECPTCDFALLILAKDVDIDEYVQMASLPRPDEPCPAGKNLVACGWGADYRDFENYKDKLMCIAQECVKVNECTSIAPIPDEYALCVTDRDEPKNSVCHHDSGGPLTYTDENGKTTLYGVTQGPGLKPDSYLRCESKAVFSRVTHPKVLIWIEKVIAMHA